MEYLLRKLGVGEGKWVDMCNEYGACDIATALQIACDKVAGEKHGETLHEVAEELELDDGHVLEVLRCASNIC